MVVLPAESRPSIRTRISLLPKSFANKLPILYQKKRKKKHKEQVTKRDKEKQKRKRKNK